MELSIGFSPCPNDTFIFDALVNGEIDTKGIHFKPVLEDVQTLNEWALEGKLDITKLSYNAYFSVKNNYTLLSAGSALGKGVGPLLISREPISCLEEKISEIPVAIPGIHTTAHALLQFAFHSATKKTPVIFSEIENAVLSGAFDLGVIIHENRFTYREKGLHLVMDLGSFWEAETGAPIPLGGIVIKNKLGGELQSTVNELIKESLALSWSRYPALSPYVTAHAQEMSEAVMRQHIELYVNNYTRDLGTEGKRAIQVMEEVLKKAVSS